MSNRKAPSWYFLGLWFILCTVTSINYCSFSDDFYIVTVVSYQIYYSCGSSSGSGSSNISSTTSSSRLPAVFVILWKCAGGVEDSAIALFCSARGGTWESRERAYGDVERQEGRISQLLVFVLECLIHCISYKTFWTVHKKLLFPWQRSFHIDFSKKYIKLRVCVQHVLIINLRLACITFVSQSVSQILVSVNHTSSWLSLVIQKSTKYHDILKQT